MATDACWPPGALLLATDGQPRSVAAERWALELAAAMGRSLVALHVRDPFLRKFENELYAQGRQAYLDHVDRCLDEQAAAAREAFARRAGATTAQWSWKLRQGAPLQVLREEIAGGEHCLLVLGRGPRAELRPLRGSGLAGRLLATNPPLPVLTVPQQDDGRGVERET